MKRRIFAAAICLCLLIGILPAAAFAGDSDQLPAGPEAGAADEAADVSSDPDSSITAEEYLQMLGGLLETSGADSSFLDQAVEWIAEYTGSYLTEDMVRALLSSLQLSPDLVERIAAHFRSGGLAAPERVSITATSAAYTAVKGQEYTIALKGADPDWAETAVPEDGYVYFEDLAPATEYTVYTRIEGTEETAEAGLVTTLVSSGIEGVPAVGSEITAVTVPGDVRDLTFQWYYVEWVSEEEISYVPVSGADTASYRPTAGDEGKTLLVIIRKGGEEIGSCEAGPVYERTCSRFSDVDPDKWYADAVDYVVENDIMRGTSDTTFEPETNMTRAMFAQIIFNLEAADGQAADEPTAYSDVPEGYWAADAIRWVTSSGVMQGYGNGKFGPKDNMTREQLVTALCRYVEGEEADDPGADAGVLDDYDDAQDISGWAVDAFRRALQCGIIVGNDRNMLLPKAYATRAQMAEVIMRLPFD